MPSVAGCTDARECLCIYAAHSQRELPPSRANAIKRNMHPRIHCGSINRRFVAVFRHPSQPRLQTRPPRPASTTTPTTRISATQIATLGTPMTMSECGALLLLWGAKTQTFRLCTNNNIHTFNTRHCAAMCPKPINAVAAAAAMQESYGNRSSSTGKPEPGKL